MNKILIFGSGNGSNFQTIAEQIVNHQAIKNVKLVLICNNPKAKIIQRALALNVQTIIIDDKAFANRSLYETEVLRQTNKINPSLIVLAGYMKILSSSWTQKWGKQTLNIHPSLLPSFKGMHAIADAYNYGCKVTGITIHLVNEKMDEGKIVFQKAIEIDQSQSLAQLEEQVHQIEHKYYIQVIKEQYLLWEKKN